MGPETPAERESGSSWYARTLQRRPVRLAAPEILGELPRDGSGALVEIQGESGSGKTLFLTHLAATCILPPSFRGAEVGGLGAGVMFVDTECDFSVLALASLLATRVERCFPAGGKKPFTAHELELLVLHCLKRLVLHRLATPEESSSFASKLRHALLRRPDVDVVLWDSVSAFHWTRVTSARSSGRDGTHSQYALLGKLLKECGVPVIVAVNTVFAPRRALPPQQQDQHQDEEERKNKAAENWQNFLGPGWRDCVLRSLMFKKVADDGRFRVRSRDTSSPSRSWRMTLTEFDVLPD